MSQTPDAIKEFVLSHVLNREPDEKSPYAIDGHPGMWIVARCEDGADLAVRPARAQERIGHQYQEVDGVAFQKIRNGEWIDQGMKSSWQMFAGMLADLIGTTGQFLQHDAEPEEDMTP
ncbi:hypothetical protein KUV57_11245 [Epibacterium sp. DP7N7-1]|nr:hypothetical protein [Epibacterium sp. DP7N7-1]